MYVVYALVDPRDNLPFYVGITDNVYARFQQHIRCDGSNFRRDTRIRELKEANIMLVMTTLQTVDTIEKVREREVYWIHHYLQLGILLLNNDIPNPIEYRFKQQLSPKNQIQLAKTRRDREADQIIAFLEDKKDKVLALHSKGWGKQAIIERLWSVTKGGSPRYRDAEAEYEAIIANAPVESEA